MKQTEIASEWLLRISPIAKRLNEQSRFDTRQTRKEGDPGRKEKRRSLEERYGLDASDLPGGINDDREDH